MITEYRNVLLSRFAGERDGKFNDLEVATWQTNA